MTWEQCLKDFADGLITPRGLVYYSVACRGKPGYRLRIEISKYCKDLKIHTATYYRAIAALKTRKRLEVEAPGGMVMWIPTILESAETEIPQDVSQTSDTIRTPAKELADQRTPLQQSDKHSQFGETPSQQRNNSANV